MSGRIEPRLGGRVYVSDRGFVCIQQQEATDIDGEMTFIFHPDEVEALIKLLEKARQEALDHVPPDRIEPIDADVSDD